MLKFSTQKKDIFKTVLQKYNYQLKLNDILAGEVVGVERKHNLINLGLKTNTLLINEGSLAHLPTNLLKVTDQSEFIICNRFANGKYIICSLSDLFYIRAWQRYKQLDLNKAIIYLSSIQNVSWKGKSGKIDKLSIFLPNTHLPRFYKRKKTRVTQLPAKTLEVSTTLTTPNIIASCKLAILEKQKITIRLNQVFKGCVVGTRPFGAFVNVRGIKCLLHISEVANTKILDLNKLLHIGDRLLIKIIYIDLNQGRISVSLKRVN